MKRKSNKLNRLHKEIRYLQKRLREKFGIAEPAPVSDENLPAYIGNQLERVRRNLAAVGQ